MSVNDTSNAGGFLRRFVRWNRQVSFGLMPQVFRGGQGSDHYYEEVRQLIRRHSPAVVVDVGAGSRWCVGEEIRSERKFKLIGQDVDGAELALNTTIDESVVCDASLGLGVPDASADLVVSHFAIEHIPDNGKFIAATHRALKAGGRVALVFQGKWAPSSVLNRLLPEALTLRLLKALVPGSDGHLGFKTYYDKCTHSVFKAELERQGFVIEHEYNSYYNGNYFAFFVPLYVAALGIDFVRMWIGNRDLATQCVFVARKV